MYKEKYCSLYCLEGACDEIQLLYGGEILECEKCPHYTLKEHDKEVISKYKEKLENLLTK